MTLACLRALLSHWRRNLLQLFAFIAGLALATGLWSGVQAINAEARASYDAAATTLGEGQFDQLVPLQGDAIAQDTYVALRRAGWLVSPVLDVAWNGVRLVGLDPLTSPTAAGLAANTDTALLGSGEAVLAASQTARLLDGEIAVLVDETIAPGLALGDIGLVQRLSGRADLSRLVLLPDQPLRQTPLEDVAPLLRLQPSQQVADVAQLTDSFHLNLTAFGLLSFAVGLFIVHSTIGLAFEQRRPMIRTLRALGVPLRRLIAIIVLEMMVLAMLAAALGIVLGYGMAALLLPDVAATLRGLYGAQVSGTLAIRPEWWLSGFALALIGTGFALTVRLWQIGRMPVLASARPRAWIMAGAGRFRALGLAALFLLVAAGALGVLGNGLVAGFACLGALLIGAALALPALADAALRVMQRRSSAALWHWFWADTRQQLPGLSLALMALLLAVSANIGVSTMVSSFRLTFTAFLDQRLAPELFVQLDSAEQSAALEAYLAEQGLESLPLLSTRQEIEGQPSRLFGVVVGPTYRENWAFLDAGETVWDRVAQGDAVVVNEQLARRADLWVGDQVTIAPGLRLPIAAVVGDYGNPQGQVVTSRAAFSALYPALYPAQFGIRTKDPAKTADAIRNRLDLPSGSMIDQASIKAMSLSVFERTFAVTAALNVLTLGVAGFAILMSLLTLADLRVPQLAPVWALGLTRAQLGRLELLRALALGAVVFLCALPLGLALAWVLLTIINVEAFGWQLPMYLFPADYAALGGYALVAATLAALWPARRLMRTPPSALLKVFAHER